MPNTGSISDLKEKFTYWNTNPCGTRYMSDEGTLRSRALVCSRTLHRTVARFSSAQGQRVLEVGVGIGADYVEWLKAGAHATGVDLSSESSRELVAAVSRQVQARSARGGRRVFCLYR
jgi:cyclopropane fatty-acyl-phospholipid synthase-like methyltransferase